MIFFLLKKEENSLANEEGLVDVAIEPEKIIPDQVEVPILVYHHVREFSQNDSENDRTFIVPKADLEELFKYLRDNNFTSISFKNLADYFSGDFIMPPKPVIISFDDGLISQYENALPLLKQYNLTATFFIFTNPVGKSKNYMDWENIMELDSLGMEIGSHGHYHLFFDRISDQELEKEIFGSKKIIEENLGKKIYALAYPFGNYNEDIITLVKEAGFVIGRGITNGVIHKSDSLYYLDSFFSTSSLVRFKYIIDQ